MQTVLTTPEPVLLGQSLLQSEKSKFKEAEQQFEQDLPVTSGLIFGKMNSNS